jgi:RNA polymerase sigma factor (sigma-70 family)
MARATLADILQCVRSACAAQDRRDLTDAELLARFRGQREEAAFAVLLERHGPMVLAVCRRMLANAQDAEDAFQATFLILVRRGPAIRKHTSVGSWLYGVARRVAAKLRVQTTARRQRERRSTDMHRTEPLDDLTWAEVRQVLDDEIGRLPENQRVALIHCALEGLSYGQASARLGWPKNTLAKRLSQARAMLRNRLAQRGIPLSATGLAVVLQHDAAGAPLSARLTLSVVRAAGAVLTGKAGATGMLSARALALAEQAVEPALGAHRKLGLVGLLVLGLTLGGAVLATQQAVVEQSDSPALKEQRSAQSPGSGQAKKDAVALDHFGDPLPEGAVERLGSARWRGGSRTSGLAFAPGGKVLASSGLVGFGLCLWDSTSGRPLHRLTVPFLCETPPAFSPDGKAVLVAGRFRGQANKVFVMDVGGGQVLSRQEARPGCSLDTVAFSPDGRLAAASESGGQAPTVVLWDVASTTEIRRLAGHTETIQTLAFSADSRLLASGGEDRSIRLWDPATGKELRRLPEQAAPVVAVAFAPSGAGLASLGGDGVLRLWDCASGKELQHWTVAAGSIQCFAFSPDGQSLASGESGGLVRLWEVRTGRELRRWQACSRKVSAVAFSPSGAMLATAGFWEHAIRHWDVATGKEIDPLPGHTACVDWLRFAKGGKALLSGGFDGKVMEWDPRTGQQRTQIVSGPLSAEEASDGSAITSALSASRQLLARANKFTGDHTIRLWDMASGKQVHKLGGHIEPIVWFRFSPDDRLLASAAYDGTRVWDTATGKELYLLPGNAGVAFSPDGKFLAAAGQNDRTVRLVEAATGKEARRWQCEQEEIWQVLFSPDGKFLFCSGASGSGITVWAVQTGRLVHAIPLQGFIDSMAVSATGRLLAASVRQGRHVGGGDIEEVSTLHVWEMLGGDEVRRIDLPQGSAAALAFAADSRTLASGGSDSTILLWDLTGGTRTGQAQSALLTPAPLAGLWTDLGGPGSQAEAAIWALVRDPVQSVPFLRDHLQAVAPADAKAVDKLLADLASPTFAVRRGAVRALEELGEAAEPALGRALEANPALEVRQQVEQILNKRLTHTVRQLRAIEILELIGSAQARDVLEGIERTASNGHVADAARAALQRLR